MKISALIEYLAQYLKEHGDVNLDVEFAGAPKTPPPETQIPIIPPDQQPPSIADVIDKLQRDWEKQRQLKKGKSMWPDWKNDDYYDSKPIYDYKKIEKYSDLDFDRIHSDY